jgi:hypothetical protein
MTGTASFDFTWDTPPRLEDILPVPQEMELSINTDTYRAMRVLCRTAGSTVDASHEEATVTMEVIRAQIGVMPEGAD